MNKRFRRSLLRCLSLTLTLALAFAMALPGLSASASTTPTSLGLAEQGIIAYRDGWLYDYGAKGYSSGGTRYSDCAGLLYSYYADCGNTAGLAGGASSMVRGNCVFSNDISEGLPRIHGLAITMPDYNDPPYPYQHIGIYIGNNEACDNSWYGEDMRREPVIGSGRDWTAWHVFDQGTLYPRNGWFAFNGGFVHYTNYQYDVNATFDGVTVGADGYATSRVDSSLLSSDWATAKQVADYLQNVLGFSGHDSTYEIVTGQVAAPDNSGNGDNNGGTTTPTWEPAYNGRVTASSLNVRQYPSAAPNIKILTTLGQGAGVTILNPTNPSIGGTVTIDGKTSNDWYEITTAGGTRGYVSALLVESSDADPLDFVDGTPSISVSNGYVRMSTEWRNANIYYTTDGSEPTENSNLYIGRIHTTGYTFKAVTIKNNRSSDVASLTVVSNSRAYTDINASDWYFPAVQYVTENSLFFGTTTYTFNPTGRMTRGQFVTVLGRLAGVDTDQYTSTRFTDVAPDAYYAPYVAWASETGIISGTSATTFAPKDNITREQIAFILYNYAQRTGNNTSYSEDRYATFTDTDTASKFAREALQWAVDKRILNGDQGQLNPKGLATRAQVAQIFRGSESILTSSTLLWDNQDDPTFTKGEMDAAWLESPYEDLFR